MYPIIMVANFSGNVGKTTLTKNLLYPNIPDVEIYAVEDINAGYGQGEATQLSAAQTQEILEKVIEASFNHPVIVDVGASNVSTFFSSLAGYAGIQEFITKVIVPTEPSEKVQTDTVSTLQYLIDSLGFEAEKIALILNKVPTKIPTESVFGSLIEKAAELGVFVAGKVVENETFQIATTCKKTIADLAQLDPKEILKESKEKAEKGGDSKEGVRMMLAAASAKKLKKQLDELFAALNIDVLGLD